MSEMFASVLPESVIKRLSIRARELGAINLGQGIPSFPTPPHIIEAVKAGLDDPTIGVYPNFFGEIALRQAIATRIQKDHGLKIDALKNVLVTVGAMEGTATAILSLIGNSDRVGIVTPDYCNHFPQVMLARGKVIPLPLIEGKDWTLDLSLIKREAKLGMKLLLLTNPSNPTGFVASKRELQAVIDLAHTYGFWILSDETYSYLTYDASHISLLDVWVQSERLVVVRSFSKEYAMTGWRVGFVHSDEENIREIVKVHDSLVTCAPVISQYAAIAAFDFADNEVESFRRQYQNRRDLICRHLDDLNGVFSYQKPNGSYFVFPKILKTKNSWNFAAKLLREAKVAVVPGAAFGPSGESHIRMSFGRSEKDINGAMEKIKKYFIE